MVVVDAYKIEYLRKQRKLLQRELATAGEVSMRTIGRIIAAAKEGDGSICMLDVRLSTINGLASALGTTGTALLKEV